MCAGFGNSPVVNKMWQCQVKRNSERQAWKQKDHLEGDCNMLRADGGLDKVSSVQVVKTG